MSLGNAKFLLFYYGLILVIPGVASLFLGIFGKLGIFCLVFNFAAAFLIISAKIRAKARSGVVVEWGWTGMTNREKMIYVLGYVCLLISIGLLGCTYLFQVM
jgi:hypothetical protein